MKIQFSEIRKEEYKQIPRETIEGIIAVAMDAFGEGMTRKEVMEHIEPTDRIYLAASKNAIAGFATVTIKSDVVDLTGAAVRKDYQTNGIYYNFARSRIILANAHGINCIDFRTQNPNVEKTVLKAVNDMTAAENQNSHSAKQGEYCGFNVHRGIVRGLYGRMLTSERPFCGEENIDKKYDLLNYERGDGFTFTIELQRVCLLLRDF